MTMPNSSPDYEWCIECGELVPKFPHKENCEIGKRRETMLKELREKYHLKHNIDGSPLSDGGD